MGVDHCHCNYWYPKQPMFDYTFERYWNAKVFELWKIDYTILHFMQKLTRY